MIFLITTQVILSLATFVYHIVALDELTIIALASTNIKGIEGDDNVTIAQATKEKYFICKFSDDSFSELDLNQVQSTTLILMLSSSSVVSGQDKAIVETDVGRN